MTFNYESLASVPEGDLIRRLLADPHLRSRVFDFHGLPKGVQPYTEMDLAPLPARGDIDVLLVNPAAPECATAIQAKRLKISESTFKSGKPNRSTEIQKLYRQTNILLELGFWQVMSYIFVVVDSRTRNLGRYQFDGLTQDLKAIVKDITMDSGLYEDAGLMVVEIVQPMDDKPLGTGTMGMDFRRLPANRPQSPAVTDWVKKKLAGANA